MKNHFYIFLVLLCPVFVFGQNVEVNGGIIADSLDVSSGKIKNVADPKSAQDAATKAYVDELELNVDALEANVDALEAKVDLLINYLVNNITLTVQQRLDLGETPKHIYDSDNSLLDSLYGKTYQGGLIAYLNTTTGTGLIAAPEDQTAGTEWGCWGTQVGGTSSDIGTGQSNTTAIVNGCAEPGIAARLCEDLNDWGYDDWYLPSKDELNQLYLNLKVNGLGGFTIGYYWSSTEFLSLTSWVQYFNTGYQFKDSKFYGYTVRAVRAF